MTFPRSIRTTRAPLLLLLLLWAFAPSAVDGQRTTLTNKPHTAKPRRLQATTPTSAHDNQRIHLQPRPPKQKKNKPQSTPQSPQGVSLRGADEREHFSFQTTDPEFRCFESNQELRAAVVRYESYKVFDETLATTYGWPIGNWCVSKVTDFSNIFQHQRTFNDPLSGWDTSRATTMANMFQDAQKFDQPLGHFNTTLVRDMSNMFEAAIRFLGDGLEEWNVRAVENMDFMFMHALNFQQDVGSWHVENVVSMKGLFKDARSFSREQHLQLLGSWSFHPQVDMTQMDAWWLDASSVTYGRDEVIQMTTMATNTYAGADAAIAMGSVGSAADTATSTGSYLRG